MLGVLLAALVNVVDAAPDAPCMDAVRVERVRAAVDGPGVRLALRRTASGALGVALSAKGRPSLEREVPVDAGACDAVERVVVSLVRAWLSSPMVPVRVDAGIVAARGDAGPDTDAGVARFGTGASGDLVSDAGAASGGVAIAAGEKGTDAGVNAPVAASGLGSTAREKATDAGVNAPVATSGFGNAARERATAAGVTAPPSTGGVATTASEDLTDGGVATGAIDPTTSGKTADGRSVTAAGDRAIDMASSTRSDAGVSANEATASSAAGASSTARSSWTFGAGLFGGIASGSTSDVLPQGLLSLDATWRWLGVALDVGLSGALSRQVAPGSVSASWQWLSLSARAAWPVTRRLLLDVQVGARVHRLSASAAGFSQVEPPQALLSVGGVASVGASFTLVGPVGVSLRGSGALRPPERFVITDLGPVLDLGAFEGAVFAGVVTRW
jgi:hypothetical protein